jgi:hypothetical protein
MMRTTPCRRTTLHFTQIFRTDDLTFTADSLLASSLRARRRSMRLAARKARLGG